MVPYLRAANVKDGKLDLTDVKEMNFNPNEQSTFALNAGDVLVTEGSGSIGAVGASAVWNGELDGVVCFQNTLLRLRPRPSTDPRFLAWWCRYAFGDGLFASIATGANIFHVSADRVRSLPMAYLPLGDQRAIADYLDAETARLDALIGKKQQMVVLLRKRVVAAIDYSTAGSGELVQVRHLASRLTSGPRGWADFVADEGTPFIRITNIQRLSIELDMANTLFVDPPKTAEARRTEVREGDVLISITADVGSVGVARVDQEGANVSQHVALLSPKRSIVEPDWMALAIRSTHARGQLDSGQYGGTKTQLSLGDVASLRVPLPSLAEQRIRLARLHRVLHDTNHTVDLLGTQIGLLREHRDALIKAAVEGHLENRGVAA
jgi:type I restriction enzyme S subunit